MAYSQQIKNEVKKEIINGEKISDISKKCHISLPTLYKWKKELDIEKRVSSEIKELIGKKEYEKTEEIGNRKEFKNYEPIQSQMITIAMKKREYEMENVNDVPILQSKEITNKQLFLNEIKTKLYYDKISQEDIENIEKNIYLSDFEKTCMILAIYEKRKDIKYSRRIAKNYKLKNKDSKQNSIINIIMQKIENKKATIFDMGFYDEIIGWKFDENLQRIYEKEKNKEQDLKREKKVEQTQKNKKCSPVEESKHATQSKNQSTSISNRYINSTPDYYVKRTDFKKRIKVQVEDNLEINSEKQTKREKNIYSEIKDYLDDKRKIIYVNMQSQKCEVQRKAISNWDKMEILIEKLESNRDNIEFLNILHEKISKLKEKESGLFR